MPLHESVTGITRSGKSYYAAHRATGHRGPVIIVDPQMDPVYDRWPRADGGATWRDVWTAACRGGVVFAPDWRDKLARAQVAWICAEVISRAAPSGYGVPVLVVVDEAHLLAPEGQPAGGVHQLARRGLRWGVQLAVVSQRPQDVAKGVLSQCARHVIYRSEYQTPYWTRYGIPAEDVQARLAEGGRVYAHRAREGAGPWPYVVWEDGRLSGPHHL